jgi:hypothetical protein
MLLRKTKARSIFVSEPVAEVTPPYGRCQGAVTEPGVLARVDSAPFSPAHRIAGASRMLGASRVEVAFVSDGVAAEKRVCMATARGVRDACTL